jgi:peptide deformylase
MSILKVARIGNPILRQPSNPVPKQAIGSPELERLIEDMIETMIEYEGVGLAAPQVHESLRLVVLQVPGDDEQDEIPLAVLINPVVTPLPSERVAGWEGCLSVPDLRGMVTRPDRVRLEALDREGRPIDLEASGFHARVIQHECDHLDGVIYIDRMDDLETLSFLPEFERYVAGEGEIECA